MQRFLKMFYVRFCKEILHSMKSLKAAIALPSRWACPGPTAIKRVNYLSICEWMAKRSLICPSPSSPGWVVKSEAAEVLLITRLQGTRGCRPEIRLVRKAFHEFSPRKLLLAALQGIADAFGIGELEAVCATNQKFYRKEYADLFKNRL